MRLILFLLIVIQKSSNQRFQLNVIWHIFVCFWSIRLQDSWKSIISRLTWDMNLIDIDIYKIYRYKHEYISKEPTNWFILTLREKSPNTEFFLVLIFPHSDWIPRDSLYLSVFSPNAGNTDKKKLRIWTLFKQRHKLVLLRAKNTQGTFKPINYLKNKWRCFYVARHL